MGTYPLGSGTEVNNNLIAVHPFHLHDFTSFLRLVSLFPSDRHKLFPVFLEKEVDALFDVQRREIQWHLEACSPSVSTTA
jgi:hypothetical protein